MAIESSIILAPSKVATFTVLRCSRANLLFYNSVWRICLCIPLLSVLVRPYIFTLFIDLIKFRANNAGMYKWSMHTRWFWFLTGQTWTICQNIKVTKPFQCIFWIRLMTKKEGDSVSICTNGITLKYITHFFVFMQALSFESPWNIMVCSSTLSLLGSTAAWMNTPLRCFKKGSTFQFGCVVIGGTSLYRCWQAKCILNCLCQHSKFLPRNCQWDHCIVLVQLIDS